MSAFADCGGPSTSLVGLSRSMPDSAVTSD